MSLVFSPVKSGNIKARAYDAQEKKLYLRFWSGKTYAYHPVEADFFKEFEAAESKGGFFHSRIRGNSMLTAREIQKKG